MRLRCGRVAGLIATVLAASATVATAQTDEADTNPCHDPALALRCPDLRMAPPTDLRVQRAGSRLRLLATNRIVNVGTGALELRGGTTRDHGRATYAKATQIIRGRDGRPYYFP